MACSTIGLMTLVPDPALLLLPYREALPSGSPPLRVAVVVNRNPPSPWVRALLAFLRQIPGIDVHLLSIATGHPPESTRPAWLMDRLYSASRAKFDPFGDPALNNPANSLDTQSLDAIRAAHCGVILWLAPCPHQDVELRSLATHGVFTVRFGDSHRAIPFWDEVAASSVTSHTTIFWHDISFAQGRAVRRAETSTCPGLYVTVNAEQPLAAAIRILASLCLDIHCGAGRFTEDVRRLVPQPLGEPIGYPSNFEAARFAVNKLTRSAYLRYTTRGQELRWFIAMRPNAGQSVIHPSTLPLTGFVEIPLPSGVDQMADPFLWEADGHQYLLFEEIAAGSSRGRLGCVEVLPDGSCSAMKIILDLPYHLSYPCVVPSNGELFLLPETAGANRVDLYRFSRFPWEMELVSSPVEGLALVDTTPVCIDGHWYFFTTTMEPYMESLLFSSPRLDGPWKLHPSNPVSTSVRSCRSAGQLFWHNGRLFRPTQDCSVRYGYAMTVNEVTQLTPHTFEERAVSYLPPSWTPGLFGTHTWNESSRWQVIDGIRAFSS